MTWLSNGRRVGLVLGAAALLYLLPLAASPSAFPFPPDGEYSDALTAHLTSALILRRSIQESAQIPLWNPTLLGGIPFAADPLSGLWYPPLWALALAPEAPVLNLILWAHLVFGGLGMHRLLRAEGVGELGASAGALAFSGMPKLIGHIGLGHVGLVSAVCWSPWVLREAVRLGRPSETGNRTRPYLRLGLLLGAVFLADPRWSAPVAMAALALVAWHRPWRAMPWRMLAQGAAAALLGFTALAAGLALPLAEFTGLSTRANLAPEEANSLALPPARLLGFLVTDRGGWAEWMVSIGSVVLILAAIGLLGSPRRAGFWGLLVGVTAVLALGDATPLGLAATHLPGLGLLRVPARWLLLTGLGMAALAGWGIDSIVLRSNPAALRRMRAGALTAAALVVALSAAVASASSEPAGPLAGLVFALLVCAVVWRAARESGPSRITLALIAILVFELIWIDASLIDPRPAQASLGPGRRVAEAVRDRPAGSRVYSPSYSLPQPAAGEAGIDLADGVHPLQLRTYVEAMAQAAGFDPAGYSVTLPPYPSGDPRVDWGPVVDAEALGRLSVSRIVSAYPLEASMLTLEKQGDGVWIYANPVMLPRARVDPGPGGAPEPQAAEIVEWTPNRIRLSAAGPGTLVLSEVAYPGWRAEVDGQSAKVLASEGLLRSVELGPGEHQVVFRFVPEALIYGLGLSLASAAAVVALWRRR